MSTPRGKRKKLTSNFDYPRLRPIIKGGLQRPDLWDADPKVDPARGKTVERGRHQRAQPAHLASLHGRHRLVQSQLAVADLPAADRMHADAAGLVQRRQHARQRRVQVIAVVGWNRLGADERKGKIDGGHRATL
jgi:hypothetical protein